MTREKQVAQEKLNQFVKHAVAEMISWPEVYGDQSKWPEGDDAISLELQSHETGKFYMIAILAWVNDGYYCYIDLCKQYREVLGFYSVRLTSLHTPGMFLIECLSQVGRELQAIHEGTYRASPEGTINWLVVNGESLATL